MGYVLEGTFTANGTSTPVDVNPDFYIHLSGTFGGGTVQTQFQKGDGAWVNFDPTQLSFTAAADKTMNVKGGTTIRLNLTGATTPSIYYRVVV